MIRPAEKSDASRIAEILIFTKRAAYRDIFKNDAVSFGEMQVLPLALEYRDNPDALKDVYVLDDGIVKAMARAEYGQTAEICEFYVDAFFHGQGLGSKMMTWLLNTFKERGTEKVRLWVLEKNVSARGFYEKFCFHPSGKRKIEDGTEEYLLEYVRGL